MLGMLQIALRHDGVPCRQGIFGQSFVFLANLVGCTANSYIRPVTVEYLHAVLVAAAIAVIIVPVSGTAA